MRILVAKEKHGDRYFDVTTNEQLHKVCIKLLTERLNWYNTDFLTEAKLLIKSKNVDLYRHLPKSCHLLLLRDGYEYESIELIEPESI